MKTCRECCKDKPLSEFYAHKSMLDGHLNKCKECIKARVRQHRVENLDKVKEYDKKRALQPHRVQARKEYAKTEKGKQSHQKSIMKYRQRYPMVRAAHVLVGNAIRDGRLIVSDQCSVCGSQDNVHAHHDDYTKPFDVRVLCAKCHTEWHRHNEPIYK